MVTEYAELVRESMEEDVDEWEEMFLRAIVVLNKTTMAL